MYRIIIFSKLKNNNTIPTLMCIKSVMPSFGNEEASMSIKC